MQLKRHFFWRNFIPLLLWIVVALLFASYIQAEEIPPEPDGIVIMQTNPGNNELYDENLLYSTYIDGTQRYFLMVTFADDDEILVFNEPDGINYLMNSRLYPKGSSHANLIDVDFLNFINNLEEAEWETYVSNHIFKKDSISETAVLYIPVKQLSSQTAYDVVISANIITVGSVGSEQLTWSFTTMAAPHLTSILPSSVVEDYDKFQIIRMYGDFFFPGFVDVYFGSTRARWVSVRAEGERQYLEVYLPIGSSKLMPGVYDVYVQNTVNHQRVFYGAFSVVREGERITKGGYFIKNVTGDGEVLSSMEASEDKLVLYAKYTDRGLLELNLDEVMGENVLVRKIQLQSIMRERIGELRTTSRWANISLYGLTATGSDEAFVSLGRVEPLVAQVAMQRLRGMSIKSNLIQVTGSNYRFNLISLTIPYRNSLGHNLKMMRYDETLRKWVDVEVYTVNFIDKVVRAQSIRPGIFVVVE